MRYRKSGYYRNIGLLLLRLGLGVMFILHGAPKLFGGPEVWTEYGSAMQYIGIDLAPMFFGFIAGICEFFGGIFLILGLLFTPALILLVIVMIIATVKNIALGVPFSTFSHSIELAIVFFSLLFIGPGKFSLDHRLQMKRR